MQSKKNAIVAECGFVEYFDPEALRPNFGLTSELSKNLPYLANYFFNDFFYGGLFLIVLEMADFVQSKNIWAFLAVLFLIALQDLLFLIALRGVEYF